MTDVLQLLHSVHFRTLRADRTLLSQSVRRRSSNVCQGCPTLTPRLKGALWTLDKGVLLSTGGEDLLWVLILSTNCHTIYFTCSTGPDTSQHISPEVKPRLEGAFNKGSAFPYQQIIFSFNWTWAENGEDRHKKEREIQMILYRYCLHCMSYTLYFILLLYMHKEESRRYR